MQRPILIAHALITFFSLFSFQPECLRSENWNLPSAFEQTRRRIHRCGVGLGATRCRSGAFGVEGYWHIASTRRRVSPGLRCSLGALKLSRVGRSRFVLRKALHDVLLPHQAQGLGVFWWRQCTRGELKHSRQFSADSSNYFRFQGWP